MFFTWSLLLHTSITKTAQCAKNFLVFPRTHTYTHAKKKYTLLYKTFPEQHSKSFRMIPPNFCFYQSASPIQPHPTDWMTTPFLANHLTDHRTSHAKPCLAMIVFLITPLGRPSSGRATPTASNHPTQQVNAFRQLQVQPYKATGLPSQQPQNKTKLRLKTALLLGKQFQHCW